MGGPVAQNPSLREGRKRGAHSCERAGSAGLILLRGLVARVSFLWEGLVARGSFW